MALLSTTLNLNFWKFQTHLVINVLCVQEAVSLPLWMFPFFLICKCFYIFGHYWFFCPFSNDIDDAALCFLFSLEGHLFKTGFTAT